MNIGDIYVRFKIGNEKRTEMCCLKKYLFDVTEEFRIHSLDQYIPKGYHVLQIMNEKPEVPEGKLLGYRYLLENNILKRWYVLYDSENDMNLLVIADYEDAVQEFMDNKVREKGYDDIYTCLSYKGDPNPTYNSEAEAVLNWRSQVWQTANNIFGQWKMGSIQQPTIQDVLDQLPVLEW